MIIKRDVELIEDGRRYKQALFDIAKLVDGPKTYKSSQIMEIIAEAKAAFGEHVPKYGPWPTLTDHIARCDKCKPIGQYAPGRYTIAGVGKGESEVIFQLCEGEVSGFELWKRFVDHRKAVKESADREALK